MIRKIININEEKCDGCGHCVPSCAEGAIQIIDGKARLISDLFCDGLGACLGHCPQNAITITEREAEPYNEYKVMEYIIKGGPSVIKAHLEHLREHNEMEYFGQALSFLDEHRIANPLKASYIKEQPKSACGCPGSKEQVFNIKMEEEETGNRMSHLTHWPIQLHLVSPMAAHFQGSDLLLAADCVSFSYADFHKDFLKDHTLAIACPKLDTNKEVYLEKLKTLISMTGIKSITVMIMQVPCCGGLFQLAMQAKEESGVDIPVRLVIVGVNGDILRDTNLN